MSEGGLGTKLHAAWQQWLYGSHQVKHGGGFPWGLRFELPTHARPKIWRDLGNSELDSNGAPPNGLHLTQPRTGLPVELWLTG